MIGCGLCLDFDGTIADSTNHGLIQLARIVKSINLPYNTSIEMRIRTMWGTPPKVMLQQIWPYADPDLILKKWMDDKDIIPLVTNGREALSSLASKYFLSILTSRSRKSTEIQIQNYRHLFCFVVAYDDIPFHKPDPRSLSLVLESYNRVGITKENIILVGDTISADFKLAQATGVKFYGVTSGLNSRKQFIDAGLAEDHILNSIAELPDILL